MTAISTGRERNEVPNAGFSSEAKVAASTIIVMGALITTLTGYAINAAGAVGHRVIGVATKTVDNSAGAAGDKSVPFRSGIFAFDNSAAGDLIAQADVYSQCYLVDNNTVAKTSNSNARSIAGTIVGFTEAGKVLVLVGIGAEITPRIQAGTGTLVAGVLTINTGIWVTADTRVIVTRKTPAGTFSDGGHDAPSADRVVGPPGTGVIVIRARDQAGAANTADTSTLDYLIVG